MIPKYNAENTGHIIGYATLGEKTEGDTYTCQVEVEFRGVTATEGQTLHFRTQGARDGKWNVGNVWDKSLIDLDGVPEDGVYQFTSTRKVSGGMLDISTFNVGFRCDYWASGMYRVRFVKIEKGSTPGEWSPGI